jgi:DNA-binding LacI/PurR family transcriptional regulator
LRVPRFQTRKYTIKRVSSKDVAREAGVSQSTVSRVFNSSGIPVLDETRDRVMEIAKKLGYRPSMIARSLNQQSTNIIALVVRNFYTHFYTEAIRLFSLVFQKYGYTTMLFNIEDVDDMDERLLKALEYQVAGIVITSATLSSPLVERCMSYSTPVFLFNRLSEGSKVNTVSCDNVDGGARVAEYLIDHGHRKLVYVSGESASSTNRDRKVGFFNRAAASGINDIFTIEGDFSYRSGLAAAENLIQSGRSFDAVFCGADPMAIGFMDWIHRNTELDIPRDFSLIGFDGITLPTESDYPLTTYRQPLRRMVDKTVQLMLQKIEHFTPDPVSYLFNGEIMERGTVRDRTS